MKLRNKKTEYYYTQFIRIKKIWDELSEQGYPIDDKLHKTGWFMLEKYCESLLKETKGKM